MHRLFFLSFLSAVLLSSAVADDQFDYTKKIGIGFGSGYSTPVFSNAFNDRNDGGFNIGVWGRYHFTSAILSEFKYDFSDFGASSENGHSFNLVGLYRFMPMAKLTPFAGLGVGVTLLEKKSDEALLTRLGLEYSLNKTWSLSIAWNYHFVNVLNQPKAHYMTAQVGITFYPNFEKVVESVKQEVVPGPDTTVAPNETKPAYTEPAAPVKPKKKKTR